MEDKTNPKNNIGAIFEKANATNSYFLIKVTIDGKNNTLVAFKNKNHNGEEYSKDPLWYIFPYKQKEKTNE